MPIGYDKDIRSKRLEWTVYPLAAIIIENVIIDIDWRFDWANLLKFKLPIKLIITTEVQHL